MELRCLRALAVTAALVLVGFAAGCSDSDEDASSSSTTDAAATSEQPSEPEEETLDVVGSTDGGDVGDGAVDQNVVGGQPIDITALPWTVALVPAGTEEPSEDQFCGGTLINDTWVMTAAHCVTEQDEAGELQFSGPESVEVVLGRSQLDEEGGERIAVKSVNVATDYDPALIVNDFALLELAEPSDQTPVALPLAADAELWAPGASLVAAGWGCQRSNAVDGQPCEVAGGSPLQFGIVQSLAPDVCAGTYGTFDAATQLCNGDSTQQASICFGDSGGPIMALGPDDRFFLVGVSSFVAKAGGCQPGVPAAGALVPAVLAPDSGEIDPAATWWVCGSGSRCTLPDA